MRHEKQPTNDELRAALRACQSPFVLSHVSGWRRRVEHLAELMAARHKWDLNDHEEYELARTIRRYLRGAGLTV